MGYHLVGKVNKYEKQGFLGLIYEVPVEREHVRGYLKTANFCWGK